MSEEHTQRERALEQKLAKPPVYQGLLAYFPKALAEVARVSAYGSAKHQFPYTDRGFMAPKYPIEGYADAAARHLLDRASEGEINAADGGVYHLAQVAWDALAALEKVLTEEQSSTACV